MWKPKTREYRLQLHEQSLLLQQSAPELATSVLRSRCAVRRVLADAWLCNGRSVRGILFRFPSTDVSLLSTTIVLRWTRTFLRRTCPFSRICSYRIGLKECILRFYSRLHAHDNSRLGTVCCVVLKQLAINRIADGYQITRSRRSRSLTSRLRLNCC